MKRLSLLIIGALLLTGCTTSTNSSSNYSSSDIAFAEMMIPHHEQAIEMAEIAALNTSSPEVLQLAQEIKDAQSPEINLMKSWAGVEAAMHVGHLMEGMLSESELTELREAKDVVSSDNQEVADLGASIIKAQETEIAQMKEILLKS
jgi:uncharacterized protein (DUF305 family)